MDGQKPTLNDVATHFDEVATIHMSTGHCDVVDKAVDMAATVRAVEYQARALIALVRTVDGNTINREADKLEKIIGESK